MKFSAMLLFLILWSLFVYDPMAHMVWGKGGLLNASLGGRFPTLDFAGGTVVHVTLGVSPLICSAHSTLVEVIAQDQPGLLHRISSKFSQELCNIEIALVETEGQTAIDVYYLTSNGLKLNADQQSRLRAALLADLVS